MDLIKRIDRVLHESSDYDNFFKKKLKEWNVTSPSELSKEDKKKFFNEVEKEWKGEKS